MVEIVPTIGRIVIYKLSADDVEGDENSLTVGEEFPAIVVEVFGDKPESRVILRVFMAAIDDLRVGTAVGDVPGTYRWMDYQKGQAAKYEELERKQSENLEKKAAFETQESSPADAKPQWPNKKGS